MDWRTCGQLQFNKKADKYYYQGRCAGECHKVEVNDKVMFLLEDGASTAHVLEYAVGYAWRDTNGFDLTTISF
jgi:hypothetical protein